jgi:HPt (histidine-containing phosphotransfer) domain-containing protein
MHCHKQIFSLISQDLNELISSAESESENLLKLKTLAHKLKGSLGFLGEREASVLCKNLESKVDELKVFLESQISNIKKIRDQIALKVRF